VSHPPSNHEDFCAIYLRYIARQEFGVQNLRMVQDAVISLMTMIPYVPRLLTPSPHASQWQRQKMNGNCNSGVFDLQNYGQWQVKALGSLDVCHCVCDRYLRTRVAKSNKVGSRPECLWSGLCCRCGHLWQGPLQVLWPDLQDIDLAFSVVKGPGYDTDSPNNMYTALTNCFLTAC